MSRVAINAGSGIWLRKGFINVDNSFTEAEVRTKTGRFKNAIVEPGAKFIQADILHLPFKDNYADYVELMNTIEHFPMWQVVDYVKEIYRVMKPGAKLILVTNDMTGLAIDWLRMITSGNFDVKKYYDVAETIYGNQYARSEGEVHRCPFTPAFLNYVLVNAGFTNGKGTITLIPKGAVLPTVGTFKVTGKKVARNDLLVAEVTK